jgi:hypothetical protein
MKNNILYFLILIVFSLIIKFIDKLNNNGSYLENFSSRYIVNKYNIDPYYQPFFKNWFFRRGYYYPL